MTAPIKAFTNGNRFLSNFHYCPIQWGFITFPSAEHLYQARKTRDVEWHQRVAQATTARAAKQMGREIPLRSDWEQVKIGIMDEVVMLKFMQNVDIAKALVDTGNRLLIEGNSWHDQFWGDCWCWKCGKTPGQNALGIILMRHRLDAHQWI